MEDNRSTLREAKQYTLIDVARLAGVSIATVSRVINDSDLVSDVARAKVVRSISRLKYVPNAHAVELGRSSRGISRGRSIRFVSTSHLPLK